MCYQFQTTKMLDGSSIPAVASRAPTGCPLVAVSGSSLYHTNDGLVPEAEVNPGYLNGSYREADARIDKGDRLST